MNTTVRSIGAITLGFFTVVVLSVVTDRLFLKIGVSSNINAVPLWLALIYRGAYCVLGGYVTARLAPGNKMKHAVILGIIGTVVAVFGAIAGWHLASHWYPITLAIISFPCVYYGGRLALKYRLL